MVLPPEFLRPFWNTASNITEWFNWEALSAIGTVGALWFVVVQSTRTGRAERARAVGLLTFLIGLIEPIEVVSIYDDTEDDDLNSLPRDLIERDLAIVRRAKEGIAALPLSEASFAGVVEWTMTLPLALDDIEKALDSQSLGEYTTVFSSLRYTEEARAHFIEERDRLRHGVVLSLIRRAWERISRSEKHVGMRPIRFKGTLDETERHEAGI
ncbi:hypothetical protein [Qipengyuania sp. NPDC077563]|uniref:hypothetical protein n=1 Tax=Qipengyuania sp. NPDC077563 TaxID=3364497 RepID=UPI00384E6979